MNSTLNILYINFRIHKLEFYYQLTSLHTKYEVIRGDLLLEVT